MLPTRCECNYFHILPSSTTTPGPMTTLGPIRQPLPMVAEGSCMQGGCTMASIISKKSDRVTVYSKCSWGIIFQEVIQSLW